MHHFNWSGMSESHCLRCGPAPSSRSRSRCSRSCSASLGHRARAVAPVGHASRCEWFAKGYVTLFRSIPLVMVLLWFFLIVPQLLQNVLGLSPEIDIRLASAMVAFSLFEAAYYSEIIRAGIQAVSRGQVNAAFALGMTYAQSMRLIVLPQAFRAMVPLLLTQAIVLFQDTSLVYVISLADFFRTATNMGDRDGTTVEMVLFAGACYFVVCLVASGSRQKSSEKGR